MEDIKMSDKQSVLTDKEIEDLQSIVADILASVCVSIFGVAINVIITYECIFIRRNVFFATIGADDILVIFLIPITVTHILSYSASD